MIDNKIVYIQDLLKSEGWIILKNSLIEKKNKLDEYLKIKYPSKDNIEEYQKIWNDYWAYKTMIEYPDDLIKEIVEKSKIEDKDYSKLI